MAHDTVERQRADAVSNLWRVPELPIAILSFALHFVWEFLQVPAYEGMATLPHWEGIKTCTAATAGDVGLALLAFWTTAAAFRSRRWIMHPRPPQLALFVATGVVLTVGLEFYYIEVTGRWVYSELMPRIPPFGTGLTPLLQWLVIPLLVASLSGRVLRGS